MAPRFRRTPKLKDIVPSNVKVTSTSTTAEIQQALDQARAAVVKAQKSGTPRQKEVAQKRYIYILKLKPEVIPTGQGGVSIRNLTTKQRVKNGNIETYGDKPIPPGARLSREQVADAGEKPISEYMKKKYPNKKKSVREEKLRRSEEKMKDLGYDLDDLDASNPFKKKGGKITYKMTGGQVVSHSYD